jgi:hypothetical protein
MSALRDAAIQRRRMVLIESSYYPRLRNEFRRMAEQAQIDFDAGGLGRAEIGLEVHQENIRSILNNLYSVAGESSARYLQDKFGKMFPMRLERKDMSQALNNLLMSWSSSAFTLAQSISGTTLEMMRQATAQMVADGVPENQMGKEIRKFGDGMSSWRARTIARTESHAAVMESQYEIIQEMELPEYLNEWNSGSDGRTRKSHRQADGQQRKPGELFDVGGDKLRYPGDRRGKPELVINCRCVLTQSFDSPTT